MLAIFNTTDFLCDSDSKTQAGIGATDAMLILCANTPNVGSHGRKIMLIMPFQQT